jgi:uncharacterized protein
MDDIEIGNARTAGPGLATGRLKLADYPDGSPMATPVAILTGERPGKTLWLHGCVHGNEYCGTFIIHELLRSLAPDQVSGRVIALPALNISAFHKNQRMSPFEGYGGGDMNRCFPGTEGGPLTQQMAFAVYRELKRHADLFVDFHTAMTADVAWALYANYDSDAGAQSRTLAQAWGYRDTLATPPGMLAGSAFMTAAADGIASMIVEAGGKGYAFTRDTVKDGAERLRNVMRSAGLLGGPVRDYGPIAHFSDFAWVCAPRGGLFQPSVKCGDRLQVGTELGCYFDIYGDDDGIAESPHAGTVLAIHPGPIMSSGETLVHIGVGGQETNR